MLLVPLTRSSSDLARSFDRLFDDFFDRPYGSPAAGEAALRSPALDVAETERGYSVTVDLPGVAKDAVKITIDGRRVGIAAQTQREETRKDGERMIYRERSSASFERSFTLPEEIDQEASSARLDNGLLTLVLAKKRATAAKSLTIN
jgi:HSP20 family protein